MRRYAGLGGFIALWLTMPLQAATIPAADTIYVGRILTMDATAPRAEAVAVSAGRIVAVGARRTVMRHLGSDTQLVELGERTLLPGFIDGHGHLTATAATLRYADLSSPPVGNVKDIAGLQQVLRAFVRERQLPAGSWLIGRGYDDAQLTERRHPTRDDLDAVSTDYPILVVHVSGHVAAANSRMLQALAIAADTPDPAGGVIRRRAGSSEPNGVLEEKAFMGSLAKLPTPSLDDSLRDLRRALGYYASMGITTVQDGAIAPDGQLLLDEAAKRDLLPIDVVTYRIWMPVGNPFPIDASYGVRDGRVLRAGVKLILDGSPQAKTAYLSRPYFKPPEGKAADYAGYPAMPQGAVDQAIAQALERRVGVIAHANGDAAAQMLIDAVAKARMAQPSATMPPITMIHAQTVRDDQLDRMATLGISPSFFVAHTFFWGDWHRDETLGPERGARISPLRSALDRGLEFSLHNDSPVVPPDIVQTLWSAVTRQTRSGVVLGPEQRIKAIDALRALTINAATQQGEAALKGSITVGKQADFVILSRDPTSADPAALRGISVYRTVSRGRTVYQAP